MSFVILGKEKFNLDIWEKEDKFYKNSVTGEYITELLYTRIVVMYKQGNPEAIDFVTTPKVELHVHLEGFINEKIFRTFKDFTESDMTIVNTKKTPGDIFRTVAPKLYSRTKYNNLELLLKHMLDDRVKQNIVFTQLQFSPFYLIYGDIVGKPNDLINNSLNSKSFDHTDRKKELKELFIKMIDVIKSYKTEKRYNIFVNFICDFPRWYIDTNAIIFTEYLKILVELYKEDGEIKNFFCGIGLGGGFDQEKSFNYVKHIIQQSITSNKQWYDKSCGGSNTNGFLVVPHAGEFNGFKQNLRDTIMSKDIITRVGHGVGILKMERPHNSNVLMQLGELFFDICPYSNSHFIQDKNGQTYRWDDYPITQLKGVLQKITLNSDDPGILSFNSNSKVKLIDGTFIEYNLTAEYLQLQKRDLYNIAVELLYNGFIADGVPLDMLKSQIPELTDKLEKYKQICGK